MRIVKRALDSQKEKCPICGKEYDSKYGHNPAPLEIEGKVCDECNMEYVIPARLSDLGLDFEKKAQDSDVAYRHPEYAINFEIGNRVRFKHPGQEYSDEIAEIIGFDENGLYQIKWLDDGTLSHGLSDANLVLEDFVDDYDESYEPRHAFDNKAQDSKPEKLKIVIKRINKNY